MSVSNEHCLAIGKISVAFAELESWASSFIWSLISQEQHLGQIITAEMSFSRKLDTLSALFQFRCKDTNQQVRLRDLIARISEAEQERNTVLHSLWIRQSSDPAEATQFKITAKRKRGLVHAKRPVTSQPLETIARDISVLSSELSSFMIDFLSAK